MKIFSEEELIAYHLGELSWWNKKLLRRRLEVDVKLAADSEEIAATLRAFSANPAPAVSEALLERSWHRVRKSLTILDLPPRSWWSSTWAAISLSAFAVIAVATIIAISHMRTKPVVTAENTVSPARSWSQQLLGTMRRDQRDVKVYNHRPGPLTMAPVDAVSEDSALAAHLDTAERVLTEVSHTDGPLQPQTRGQVHRLLLENAVYHQSAEQRGDMEAAAVIDDLGRVLISLDAEPLNIERNQYKANPDAFRLEMSLGGVLLDLRILHHNDPPTEEQ